MKRYVCTVVILLLLVIYGIASANENEVPAEIKQYLDNEISISEIETFSCSERFLFVVAKDLNQEKILFGFQQNDKKWDLLIKTTKIFPSNNNLRVSIYIDEEYQDDRKVISKTTPRIMLRYSEPNADYPNIWTTFLFNDDSYTLYEVVDYSRGIAVHYNQGAALIYDDDGFSFQKADIEYSAPTRLDSFDFEDFISYINEWNKKYYTLTNQIVFDENHPLLYYHPTDQIFTVYSAPTSTAYIEANGKAKVSTNDWILVYGEENNYYFIQYSIDAETMRYGYIQSDSFTCLNIGEIIWLNQESSTKKKVTLINDPCGKKTKIKMLPRGTEIKILGTLNGWAYIECYTSLVVRGFVEYKILNTK